MKGLLLSAASLLALSTLSAQNVIYRCDFEDPQENAQWTLNKVNNPRTKLKDTWHVGRHGQFGLEGSNGLYVSSQTDTTRCTSSGSQVYTVAFRNITLPVAGTYTLLFNTRINGSQSAKFHVWWLPQSYNLTSNNGIFSAQTWLNNGGTEICPDIYGYNFWIPAKLSTNLPAGPGRLVFVWESTLQQSPTTPTACIDNVELIQGYPCANEPTNLQFKSGSFVWSGSMSDNYEVCMYNSHTNTFDSIRTVHGVSYRPDLNNDEGYCYIYVRRLCSDSTHSAWVRAGTFVWVKGKRCIDYLDIGANRNYTGVCYVGSHSDSQSHTSLSFSTTPQMVDYGYYSSESMHTIHFDTLETDPVSNGKLRTVPVGEVASVRLGAYTSSGEDARIEYKYTVEPGQSDLLDLKYACVLNSGGHGAENPFFQLEILDQTGKQIPGCTQEYFVADQTGTGGKWHQEGDTWWSDWDQVTVSLRNFTGQTLTIRLTASRCVYDTHYGYAYFTMGCRSGGLEGIACGDYTTDHFKAPDGFQYEWYKQSDPGHVLTTDQVLNIDRHDTAIYVVDVISTITKTDGRKQQCSYSLTANPNPRFPMAEVAAVQETDTCTNKAIFANTSYVAIVNRLDSSRTRQDELVDEVLWDFGDGTPLLSSRAAKVIHQFPDSGGTYNVRVTATMSAGICSNDTVLTFTFPNLLEAGSSLDSVHVCRDDYPRGYEYKKNHYVYGDTTVLMTTIPNEYGCDAPQMRSIFFHESYHSHLDTNFCEGGYLDFHGHIYRQTCTDTVNIPTIWGCDSIMSLSLTVIPRLEVYMPDSLTVCADDSAFYLPYMRLKGRMGPITLYPDSAGRMQGFPEDTLFQPNADSMVVMPLPMHMSGGKMRHLEPGNYHFRVGLGTPDCPSDDHSLYLRVRYPASIIDQKNDVIALLNQDYNEGGWKWIGYQWYRNGVEIAGANTSYIVVEDEDFGAEFVCRLMNEQHAIMESCPIVYMAGIGFQEISALDVHPTCVWPGEKVYLATGGDVRVYDAIGRLVQLHRCSSLEPATISAPSAPGVYLLRQNASVARIVVK